MGRRGEWIPPSAPPSEGYWEALLREGRNPGAAPIVDGDGPGKDRSSEVPAGSVESATVEDRWEEARRLMEQEEALELPVVGYNRGGLLVEWHDLQGFVPASHLLDLSPSMEGEEQQANLRRFVGTTLLLKIIELDPEQSCFVLSERAVHLDEDKRDELLRNLRPGDVREGQVTNLCSFGAFIDLGGFEGLAHVSELSWGRVDHPDDVLDLGQDVDVYVLNVDRERERVGLSVKRLQPNPWQSAEERYHVGQALEGIVTHVVDFGAFVQVEKGLEGLIHVSELAERNPHSARDVVHEGDAVIVQVLNVDGSRRRMGLRLQRVKEHVG